MSNNNVNLLKEKIREADLVLIGIGEEWQIPDAIVEKTFSIQDENGKWLQEHDAVSFAKKILVENRSVPEAEEMKRGYHYLADLIRDKNYFIVSLCEDGLIRSVDLRDDRIVQPCGNMSKLQCPDGCEDALFAFDDLFGSRMKDITNETLSNDDLLQKIKEFWNQKCPVCGKNLVFNTLKADKYLETGYLDDWTIYKKWLQGTVNKKVCIVELGVGMKYPTVIRWPFEKIAFFNQKASFFRIHSRLFQTAEEIKEKSVAMQMTTEEFIKELSSCD